MSSSVSWLLFLLSPDGGGGDAERGRQHVQHDSVHAAALPRVHAGRHVRGRPPHRQGRMRELLHRPRRPAVPVSVCVAASPTARIGHAWTSPRRSQHIVCVETTYFALAGFDRSWKTWKSHGILKWLFPGLEKFLKKNVIPKVWEKSWKCVISECSFTLSLK